MAVMRDFICTILFECVCVLPFGNDAFRMYYLRAVCGEWGEIEIAVRRSDQVILLLHSLRWIVLMFSAFLGTVCVSEFLNGVLVYRVMTREREKQNGDGKNKSVIACTKYTYAYIHIYKYT